MQKKQDLLDALISKGLISESDAAKVEKEAQAKRVAPEVVIAERGIIDEIALAQAKGEFYNLPVKFFGKDEAVPREILNLVPEESARHYKMVAFAKDYDGLWVGMVNPQDARAQEALKFIAQKLNATLKIAVVTESDILRQWKGYRTFGEEISKALSELQHQYPSREKTATVSRKLVRLDEDNIARLEEAPIIRMVATILRQGVAQRASDIHVEPERERLKVRYRIDGILYTMLYLPLETHSPIITRIKIMADLQIDEMRKPQDGRFRTLIDEREIDFRVATFPTASGEKVAIRILDPSTGLKGLEEIGFHGGNIKLLREGIEKPFGMILATGPTGSGKTTTLYAILQILNTPEVNIVTLEDPVEYFISGVNQSQVMPEIGYTFAAGLRQIVRQDPDIIMVGEIRDTETAELAVHAALTGHIVLSTLHTNNAAGAIPRMVDLGVQPFLLPATINLVISQRLVRRLCPECKKQVRAEGHFEKVIDDALSTLPAELRQEIPYKKPYTIYEPLGCETCNQKGTLGRVGAHEILKMTPDLEKIILSDISDAKLSEEARRQGMLSMRQEGILKALEGVVGLREILEETA